MARIITEESYILGAPQIGDLHITPSGQIFETFSNMKEGTTRARKATSQKYMVSKKSRMTQKLADERAEFEAFQAKRDQAKMDRECPRVVLPGLKGIFEIIEDVA